MECKKLGNWPMRKCPMGNNGPTWEGLDNSVWPDTGIY
jgi:hypothetical protein